MRILVAPDSFKGTLSAAEAARVIQQGILAALPQAHVTCLPLADGGEGTLDAVLLANGGQRRLARVTLLDGRPGRVEWGELERAGQRVALLESARVVGLPAAQGIPLWQRSTQGVGELLRVVLDEGIRQVYLALGGTATNDGGLGMLQALGVRFFDASGAELQPCVQLARPPLRADFSSLDARLGEVRLFLLSDVTNPLLGEHGASAVYGPQKGLAPDELAAAERWMKAFAAACEVSRPALRDLPGAGAAGGLGFAGLLLGGQHLPGADAVLDLLQFEQQAVQADWIVTGEGHTDETGRGDKLPWAVLRRAQARGKPVALLSGRITAGGLMEAGFAAVQACQSGAGVPTAADAAVKLQQAARMWAGSLSGR